MWTYQEFAKYEAELQVISFPSDVRDIIKGKRLDLIGYPGIVSKANGKSEYQFHLFDLHLGNSVISLANLARPLEQARKIATANCSFFCIYLQTLSHVFSELKSIPFYKALVFFRNGSFDLVIPIRVDNTTGLIESLMANLGDAILLPYARKATYNSIEVFSEKPI